MKRRTISATAAAAATLPTMARADGPTAIRFWHAMAGQLGEELTVIVIDLTRARAIMSSSRSIRAVCGHPDRNHRRVARRHRPISPRYSIRHRHDDVSLLPAVVDVALAPGSKPA